jgi:hypothetical protein
MDSWNFNCSWWNFLIMLFVWRISGCICHLWPQKVWSNCNFNLWTLPKFHYGWRAFSRGDTLVSVGHVSHSLAVKFILWGPRAWPHILHRDTSKSIWANQPIHSFLVGYLSPCLQGTNVRVGSPQPSKSMPPKWLPLILVITKLEVLSLLQSMLPFHLCSF